MKKRPRRQNKWHNQRRNAEQRKERTVWFISTSSIFPSIFSASTFSIYCIVNNGNECLELFLQQHLCCFGSTTTQRPRCKRSNWWKWANEQLVFGTKRFSTFSGSFFSLLVFGPLLVIIIGCRRFVHCCSTFQFLFCARKTPFLAHWLWKCRQFPVK